MTALVACEGDAGPDDEPLPGSVSIVALDQGDVGKAVALNSSLGAAAPRGSTVRWEFGDGASSTDLAPTHVYDKPGKFRVRLTLSNGAGQSTGAETDIRIGRFAALQDARCVGVQKTGWCVQWPLTSEVKTLLFRSDLRAFGVSGDGKIVYSDPSDGVWHDATMDVATRSIGQIVFADAEVGWALGTTLAADSGSARGPLLLKTVDGGKRWFRQSQTGDGLTVLSRTHLILTKNGEPNLASSDGGKNWLAIPKLSTVDVGTSGTTLWAAQYSTVPDLPTSTVIERPTLLRSRDHGITYQPVVTLRVNERIKQVVFINENRGWMLTGDRYFDLLIPGMSYPAFYNGQSLWVTDDGGATWERYRTVGLPGNADLGPDRTSVSFVDANVGIGTYTFPVLATQSTSYYKTVDAGRTWTNFAPPPSGSLADLVQLGIQVAWTSGRSRGRYPQFDPPYRGVYLTRDLGTTWQFIDVQQEPADAQVLEVALDGGGAVLMRYATKTYRSTDNGATWSVAKVWPAPTSHFEFANSNFSLAFVNPSRGFAVGAGGRLLSTTDGGQHWSDQSLNLGSSAKSDAGRIQFLTASDGWLAAPSGQYRTQDGGVTWTRGLGTAYDFNFLTALIGWNVSSSPNSTSGLATLDLTLDGGVTLVNRPEAPQPMPRPRSVHFADSLVGVLVGDDGSVARTVDRGVTWIASDSGTTQAFTRVRFADATTAFAVGLNGVVIVTRDGGRTWKPVVTGVLANWRNLYFVDARRGWIVGDYGAVVATRDGGYTWQKQSSGTLEHLYDVFAVDAETVWTVGERGVIRASATGGD